MGQWGQTSLAELGVALLVPRMCVLHVRRSLQLCKVLYLFTVCGLFLILLLALWGCVMSLSELLGQAGANACSSSPLMGDFPVP